MKQSSSVFSLQDGDLENPEEKSSKKWPFSFGPFESKKRRWRKKINSTSPMSMFARISSQNNDKASPENGINNSLVSLGIAMATSTTKDIHQVCLVS